MTQEEKELLFKDLCGRFPYKVYAQIYGSYISAIESIDIDGFVTDFEGTQIEIENFKPYLFPMSSMTEEQSKKSLFTKHKITRSSGKVMYLDSPNTINYYLENHFDYRGLIEKDLAIDATNLNIY